MGEEPTTEQLRAVQADRARREAEAADEAEAAGEASARRAHARRADQAAYLADRLAERDQSERR